MKIDIPVIKTDRRKKLLSPMIFFENKIQQAVWECILKDEVDSGFWANVNFEKNYYLISKSFVYPEKSGISFHPQLMSFYFDNLDFVKENGYYISVVMKLASRYDISIRELKMLAGYVESFIMINLDDNNSDYRRVQVGIVPIDQRNVPSEYKEMLRETETYFRNLGISMEDVVKTLKTDPCTALEIRKMLREISALMKNNVDISDIIERLKTHNLS